jgi:hypothetical protein
MKNFADWCTESVGFYSKSSPYVIQGYLKHANKFYNNQNWIDVPWKSKFVTAQELLMKAFLI